MIEIGSLFSGIGGLEVGLSAGLARYGYRSRVSWQVEADPYCRQVLAKNHPTSWRFEDVRSVGSENLSPVTLMCGGFPCQDLSVAGDMRGIHASRSGLFFELARIVREIRPQIVVLENVSGIYVGSALHTVFGEMASIGYDAAWGSLRAADVGAPHRRDRFFAVCWRGSKPDQDLADPHEVGPQRAEPIGRSVGQLPQSTHQSGAIQGMANTKIMHSNAVRDHTTKSKGQIPQSRIGRGSSDMANTHRQRPQRVQPTRPAAAPAIGTGGTAQRRQTEPAVGRGAYGFPDGLDVYRHAWPAPPGPQHPWEPSRTRPRQPDDRKRLKALGNAVCPQQAAIIGEWIAVNLLGVSC